MISSASRGEARKPAHDSSCKADVRPIRHRPSAISRLFLPEVTASKSLCWWASPRPVVCRRRVGALGCPGSSRRRNIERSPQYGPRLLTVRKPRRRDHARLGTQRRATPGEAGETGYPQKPVFASADAMQRYRCVPDPTWPQLSRLSRHGRGHAVEDTASLTGRKFVAEKY